MNLSIIIPAHNEECCIEETVRSLEAAVRPSYEIVVVDDHSLDGTAGIVIRLASEFGNIRLVRNVGDPGFANALRLGFKEASGEFVVPVMADLCDEPATINRMYDKLSKGFDIVCGSRYMPGGTKIARPSLKSFCSGFVGRSLHLLIGIPTRDISNAFKLYKKEVIEKIDIRSKGFDISAEIPLKAYFMGYKISEVPTTWIDRKAGKSKFRLFNHGSRYVQLYLWALWRMIT